MGAESRCLEPQVSTHLLHSLITNNRSRSKKPESMLQIEFNFLILGIRDGVVSALQRTLIFLLLSVMAVIFLLWKIVE